MNFYETPLFIDVLLYTIYALVGIAVVLAIVSSVRSLLLRRGEDEKTKSKK